MITRKFGIRWNSTKTDGLETARRLIELIVNRGGTAVPGFELAHALGRPNGTDDFSDCEVLFVLGGDGTILSSLDASIAASVPMLGINVGRLGFLSEAEPDRMEQVVDQVFRREYEIESRLLLECAGCDGVYALNEVAFARSSLGLRVLRLEVRVNGHLTERIAGDGVIISTPTGSTAYSLSAGGPVIAPDVESILITPVCAHSMGTRPVIVSAASTIEVCATGDASGIQMVYDGRNALPLPAQGAVVRASTKRARFIRLNDGDFFQLLRKKMAMDHGILG